MNNCKQITRLSYVRLCLRLATAWVFVNLTIDQGVCEQPVDIYCQRYLGDQYLGQMFSEDGKLPAYDLIERRLYFLSQDFTQASLTSSAVREFVDQVSGNYLDLDQYKARLSTSTLHMANKLQTGYLMDWELEKVYLEKEGVGSIKYENSAKLLLPHAELLADNGNWRRYDAEISRVIELAPDFLEARLRRCKRNIARQIYSSALADSDIYLLADSSNIEARFCRCEAALACSDFGVSIEDADYLLSAMPPLDEENQRKIGLIRVLAVLGNRIFSVGEEADIASLEKQVGEVLQFAPKHRSALYMQALLDYQQGRFKEAEERYRNLLTHYPDFEHAKLRLAELLFGSGREQAVLEATVICRELLPKANAIDRSFILCALAEAEMKRERPIKAIEHWCDALSDFPQNILALQRREEAYWQLQENERARTDHEKLRELSQNSWVAWRVANGGYPMFTLSLLP